MSITAWRITKLRHAKDAFSGEGARLYGGRWNSKGTAVIYTAEHASLAVLELLVHLGSSKDLANYVIIPCTFDDKLVELLNQKKLPRNWMTSPPLVDVQRMGDIWIEESRTAALKVPSALLPIESNYLINPQHPDFSKISFADPIPLPLDPRLVG
jgi:RES domain-containing protein